MADKEYQVKDTNGTYHEVHVEDNSSSEGWSTFWKWTGIILVVLIIAGVALYFIDAWVLTDSNDTAAMQDSAQDSGGDINLNISTDGGDGAASPDSGSSN